MRRAPWLIVYGSAHLTHVQERASVREELQTMKRVLSQVKEMLQRDNSTLQDIRDLLNVYSSNITII